MRHPKIWGVIGFIMAVAMSILELATHDITCKYGMNPICFFWALRWAACGCVWLLGCFMWDKE